MEFFKGLSKKSNKKNEETISFSVEEDGIEHGVMTAEDLADIICKAERAAGAVLHDIFKQAKVKGDEGKYFEGSLFIFITALSVYHALKATTEGHHTAKKGAFTPATLFDVLDGGFRKDGLKGATEAVADFLQRMSDEDDE